MLDERIVEFSEYMADEARGIIIPRFRERLTITDKDDFTPVTEVDRQVEEDLRKLVKNNFPEHGVMGEEFGEENADAEFVWVIDPIDGTKSFITGRPIFGTLISLCQSGVPILGLIDQPIIGERWLGANGVTLFNGKRVYARACHSLESAYFATTSPFLFENDDLPKIADVIDTAKCTIYGGDCYSYAQLATGLLDIVIESGLKNYDFCALVPVIENAGGVITDWQGKALNINSSGEVIACGDAELHKRLVFLLG